MNAEKIEKILKALYERRSTPEKAMDDLKGFPFEDMGFAKVDHHRSIRKGYPEVIYGEGKTPEQIAEIFSSLAGRNPNVLCTRASKAAASLVLARTPNARYLPECRIIELRGSTVPAQGLVAVLSAGTSDMAVAEEAAVTLENLGSGVQRIYDVGVAGVHRLLAHEKDFRNANCLVVAAGMEGALPSVAAGIVDIPVIAVPTSVGYGAGIGGFAALFAMLNSCASGVSVVNIDNGFGAACQAHMINKLATKNK